MSGTVRWYGWVVGWLLDGVVGWNVDVVTVAVVADDGKTIGKISMGNAIAAMARPDRVNEGPRYK
ncbi:MAG: hypothetical protein ACPG6Q_02610 [Candidatus Puniceispirillaceae bacterium]